MLVHYTPQMVGLKTQFMEEEWAIPVGPIRWFLRSFGWQSGVVRLRLGEAYRCFAAT